MSNEKEDLKKWVEGLFGIADEILGPRNDRAQIYENMKFKFAKEAKEGHYMATLFNVDSLRNAYIHASFSVVKDKDEFERVLMKFKKCSDEAYESLKNFRKEFLG